MVAKMHNATPQSLRNRAQKQGAMRDPAFMSAANLQKTLGERDE
jgi:hypothetical protein